jgi:PAS domain S-box-containing protein
MMSLFSAIRPHRRHATSIDVADAARRIRADLDTDRVVRVTAEEAMRLFRASRASVWLASGRTEPLLAYETGHGGHENPNRARSVWRAAASRRTIRDKTGGLAVAIVAPRSGTLAVLYCEADEWTDGDLAAAEDIAREAGLALETANLYEQAVAEKEKSEAILARVGDAIIVTGARGDIREWNPAAEIIIGTGAAVAKGKLCSDIMGLHEGERALDCRERCPLLQERAATGVVPDPETHEREVWRRGSTGRRQPLLASAAPIIGPDGQVGGVVHSLRDITRLKQADEAKTLFLATASHELKTPLTVIQGFAQLLASKRWNNEEDRSVALEAIERRARELNRIVERLLLSSRIEAGRVEVHLGEADVEPILRERTEAMGAATGRDITITIPTPLPRVLADMDAFATIIDHLLDNAVKYSPDGGGIDVHAEESGSRLLVRISDHGIGMDRDQADRCFEKFWQAESNDVRRFGGTGIGLYIVRSLVEAMGGTIRAESVAGKGTTFEMKLATQSYLAPVVAAAPAPEKPNHAGEPSMVREFMRQIGVPPRSRP